jgi:hypothetical protein
VKAVIWANDTKNGVMHNVTVTRIYHDGQEWRDTQSFGRDDLLPLAKALDAAHTWICERQQANAA